MTPPAGKKKKNTTDILLPARTAIPSPPGISFLLLSCTFSLHPAFSVCPIAPPLCTACNHTLSGAIPAFCPPCTPHYGSCLPRAWSLVLPSLKFAVHVRRSYSSRALRRIFLQHFPLFCHISRCVPSCASDSRCLPHATFTRLLLSYPSLTLLPHTIHPSCLPTFLPGSLSLHLKPPVPLYATTLRALTRRASADLTCLFLALIICHSTRLFDARTSLAISF